MDKQALFDVPVTYAEMLRQDLPAQLDNIWRWSSSDQLPHSEGGEHDDSRRQDGI